MAERISSNGGRTVRAKNADLSAAVELFLQSVWQADRPCPKKPETEIQRLMGDEDVTQKNDIYECLLTGKEKKLSIRAFDCWDALAAYGK